MAKIYFDSTEQGDPVTPLTKPPITRVQIAKYAGASLDFSPLHIDDDFAKAAGYGGVFAHGAISLGFAIEAVSKWAENARILRSKATFQKLVWPGDIITAKGVVFNRYEENGEARIDVDVWAENQNHDNVMQGSITCVLWRSEKDEKRTKALWPPVSKETLDDQATARAPAKKTSAKKATAKKAPAKKAAAKKAPAKKAAAKKAPAKKAAKKSAAKKKR